jgi:hypothetical protein
LLRLPTAVVRTAELSMVHMRQGINGKTGAGFAQNIPSSPIFTELFDPKRALLGLLTCSACDTCGQHVVRALLVLRPFAFGVAVLERSSG